MNNRFFELPEEKQLAIFNAAMEVFGENEFKRASTDLIAAKAGISKGMLFYYFHNKKELYLRTHDYAMRVITEAVMDQHLKEITDFFELLTYASEKKVRMLKQNPHIMSFALRSFYSEKEEVSGELHASISGAMGGKLAAYFQNVDFGRFREGVEPKQFLDMMTWMTDGYLHARAMAGKPMDIEEIQRDFEKWGAMFRRIAYREEYQ